MSKFISPQEIKLLSRQQEFDSDYLYTMLALYRPDTGAYQIHLSKKKYSASDDTYRSAGYWRVVTYRGKEKEIKTPNSVIKFAAECGLSKVEFHIANNEGQLI